MEEEIRQLRASIDNLERLFRDHQHTGVDGRRVIVLISDVQGLQAELNTLDARLDALEGLP